MAHTGKFDEFATYEYVGRYGFQPGDHVWLKIPPVVSASGREYNAVQISPIIKPGDPALLSVPGDKLCQIVAPTQLSFKARQ